MPPNGPNLGITAAKTVSDVYSEMLLRTPLQRRRSRSFSGFFSDCTAETCRLRIDCTVGDTGVDPDGACGGKCEVWEAWEPPNQGASGPSWAVIGRCECQRSSQRAGNYRC